MDVGVGPATVRVHVPDVFPQTPETELAFARWASFLGTLLHGVELGNATLGFALPEQMPKACGDRDTLACYSPRHRALTVPTRAPAGWRLEHIVAHEYGHHVAATRNNAPWSAFEWGTKRWATVAGICAKVADASVDPIGLDWENTPGEAFAETYRLLNARRARGWGSAPGWTFGEIFPFGEVTMRALELDVRRPWEPVVLEAHTGRLVAGAAKRLRVRAVLDGTVRLRLREAPRGTLLRSTKVLDPAAPGGLEVDATVCGDRTIDVNVVAPRSGRFVLEVMG